MLPGMDTAPKTRITVGQESTLLQAVRHFCEQTVSPMPFPQAFGGDNKTLTALALLGSEIYETIEEGDYVLKEKHGLVNQDFLNICWLVCALQSIEEKEINSSSLNVIQQAPSILGKVQTFYRKRTEVCEHQNTEAQAALKKQLEKERTREGLAAQLLEEWNEGITRERSSNVISLFADEDDRAERRAIEDFKNGKLKAWAMGKTNASRELEDRIDSNNSILRRSMQIAEMLRQMEIDLSPAVTAARNYSKITGSIISVNDNIQLSKK